MDKEEIRTIIREELSSIIDVKLREERELFSDFMDRRTQGGGEFVQYSRLRRILTEWACYGLTLSQVKELNKLHF